MLALVAKAIDQRSQRVVFGMSVARSHSLGDNFGNDKIADAGGFDLGDFVDTRLVSQQTSSRTEAEKCHQVSGEFLN